MNISLFSTDNQLYQLCRDILADSLGSNFQLRMLTPSNSLPDSDLSIWDFLPNLSFPEGLQTKLDHKHLFLVQKKHLEILQERLGECGTAILLKPTSRAALSAFIEQHIADSAVVREGNGRLGALQADRDQMLQSLMLANLRLQEYDQDRTSFLTRAVHDFRTPLTAISGYCGLLLTEQLGPLTSEQKDVLERTLHSAKRLSRMATAMFELGVAHHREGVMPVLMPGDIRDCIDQALHELAHLIDEKHLAVSVDIEPCPEEICFDSNQIEQVFLNLLDNACRFTPKYGVIEIRAYPFFWERRLHALRQDDVVDRRKTNAATANSLRVDLSDSGPGIPPEHLDKLFEEYTSYSGGQDRSGAGLGLAICKMILNRHLGRIWAEGKPNGAVFSFVLPFRRAD